MGRLILIVLIVVLVLWLLRRALAASKKPPQAPPPGGAGASARVRCAHCGGHLPKAAARSAGGRHYCSEEHWRLGPRDG